MKKIFFLTSVLLAFSNCGLHAAERNTDKPNILFILLDDLGKEWVSCYGAEDIKTPHIDQLAQEGMRFENYYTMPQCTPTRIAFATGQYPYQNGWVNHWDVPRWGGGAHFDPTKNPSIGQMMRQAGYKTAVAGKWQVNDFRVEPNAMEKHGYDDYCMWTGYEAGNKPSAERYWDPYIHTKEGSKTYKGQFGEDIFTDFLINFLTEHKAEPVFIYYAMCLPHTPFVTTPAEPDAKGKLGQHKAMVRYADLMVQKMVDAVENLDLREDTLIIVTTDNGTTKSITGTRLGTPVQGAKSETIEAGTAVPFIVSQPGAVPQGKVSYAQVNITDMMATFADLGGGRLDDQYTYNSYSMKEVFHGLSEKGPREFNLSMGGGNKAKLTDKGVENQFYFRDRVVRNERYKLYIDTNRQPEKLFDLKTDPWEKHNLLDNPEYAKVAEQLFAAIQDHLAQDNDPIYVPLASQPWDMEISTQSQTWKKGKPAPHPK